MANPSRNSGFEALPNDLKRTRCCGLLRMRGMSRTALIVRLLLVLVVFLVLCILWFRSTACNAENHLRTLLVVTAEVFRRHEIVYWLDYGTMLGAIREKGIIGWEYDNDIGIPEEMCKKASEKIVRDDFHRRGYTLYNQTEYIPQKVKMTWDDQTRRLGYSSGYMTVPCIRVYDASQQYFVDVYWYKRISVATARAAPKGLVEGAFNLPKGYDYEEEMLCNAEGIMLEEFFPGGCRPVSKVLPVASVTLFGTSLSIPADAEYNLRLMYGENWMVPKAKGINGLLCNGDLPFSKWQA